MKKSDSIIATIIGFIDGIIFFFILKSAEVEIPYSWILPIALAVLAAAGMQFAFWIGSKLRILLQAAKFFLVGTLNTFIDAGVLELLTWIAQIQEGNIISFFKAISFLVATTNSYLWNKFWTFKKREEKAKTGEFLKFLVITAIGFLINVSLFHIVFNVVGVQFGIKIGMWRIMAVIVAAFGAFVWNFLASKFIVFKE